MEGLARMDLSSSFFRGVMGLYRCWIRRKVRALIPAYPNRTVDPTGAWDAFDGACLALPAELRPHRGPWAGRSRPPCSEGSGPYYALDALEGLKEARLDLLRQRLRIV